MMKDSNQYRSQIYTQLIAFCFYLRELADKKQIPACHDTIRVTEDLVVTDDTKWVEFAVSWNIEDFPQQIHNLFMTVLDNAFIEANAIIETKRGVKINPTLLDFNKEEDKIWATIYQIRNACAHTPSKPTWVIKHPAYKTNFDINLVEDGKNYKIPVDFSNLNGKPCKVLELLSNWQNVFLILKYIERI